MIHALTDIPADSPMRIQHWIEQLTGIAPHNEDAAFWFHLNGLAASARRQGMSDTTVHIALTNALGAADCECAR